MAPDLLLRARRIVKSGKNTSGGSNQRNGAAAQQSPAGQLHGRAPIQLFAPTDFAELCQFSGASTGASRARYSPIAAERRANRRTGQQAPPFCARERLTASSCLS